MYMFISMLYSFNTLLILFDWAKFFFLTAQHFGRIFVFKFYNCISKLELEHNENKIIHSHIYILIYSLM